MGKNSLILHKFNQYIGNSWLSTKDQTMTGRASGSSAPKYNKENKIKKKYEAERENNEKLQFLNNTIRRPYGFVESAPQQNDHEVPQSMATSARLANLKEKETKQIEEVPDFRNNDDELLHGIESKKQDQSYKEEKVAHNLDFSQLNNSKDQGQHKDEFYDAMDKHRNSDLSREDNRESLTFKPEGFLKAPAKQYDMAPMTFDNNFMPAQTIEEREEE